MLSFVFFLFSSPFLMSLFPPPPYVIWDEMNAADAMLGLRILLATIIAGSSWALPLATGTRELLHHSHFYDG